MSDAGRISRRTLLVGAAGGAVVLGAGLGVADYEIHQHPTWRAKIFGCGSTPPLPRSDYRVSSSTLFSRPMKGEMPYTVALPPQSRMRSGLPLVLALPGEGGQATDFVNLVGLPGYATSSGFDACFVSPGNVGSTYYHPRSNGTDMLAFIVDELIPTVEHFAGVGGSRDRRAVYGFSMGGFGALLFAELGPGAICAAAAASPAVFPSYHDAITGHPGTFDSASDWQRWGVWARLSEMGKVPVRIDCGDADPFAPVARQLIARIPGAVGHIGTGCHDVGFWRRAAPAELAFLQQHLTA